MKTQEEVREYLMEREWEESIIFESPDFCTAFIGVTTNGNAVYDYDKMVEYLMTKDCMTSDEAVDFIDYNTIRALPYMGEKAPIVMETTDETD